MNRVTEHLSHARSLVMVRTATEGELRSMATDMIRYLPHGLFPRLGRHFVRRWMRTFLTQRHGIALVAVTNNAEQQQLGFLIGSTNQVLHVADVLGNHRWSLLFSGLTALSVRPRVLLDFVKTRANPYLKRTFGRRAAPTQLRPTESATAVITSLVVLPMFRGGGIGELLVAEFLERAREACSSKAELVTTAGPSGAGDFYDKIGWDRVEEHSSKDGTHIHTYRHDLD